MIKTLGFSVYLRTYMMQEPWLPLGKGSLFWKCYTDCTSALTCTLLTKGELNMLPPKSASAGAWASSLSGCSVWDSSEKSTELLTLKSVHVFWRHSLNPHVIYGSDTLGD